MSEQSQNWQASAERHARNGENTAAHLSRMLAREAEKAEAEEAELRKTAELRKAR